MTDAATQAQNIAADPQTSTWLSANAGSGKTRVLTDRVARLLLAGSPPENILCLTYTKAAAGEMQNRLFRTLGHWSMLSDEALTSQLGEIDAHTEQGLDQARTLFARAIETPGGLKIQTIHSFCAALLRQFPLEAGVSPSFTEIDESAQRHLVRDVLEDVAERDPSGVVSLIAEIHSGSDFEALARDVVQNRDRFGDIPSKQALLHANGAPENLTRDSLAKIDLDPLFFERFRSALKHGNPKDYDLCSTVDPTALSPSDLRTFEQGLLTKEGTKRKHFPAKVVAAQMTTEDLSTLAALMDQIVDLREHRLMLEAAERTLALHRFAAELLPSYEAEKAARGWLDFDDLIAKATALLEDSAAAAWVLYKLDARIDHILVDESQDTSPAQWRVIEALSSEFGAGDGARANELRTLFVVGDKKQSIYSFQGADIAAFEDRHDHFGARLSHTTGFASRELRHSFRSAPAILQAVDATFQGDASLGLGGAPEHIAFHETRPGRVELWPLIEAEKEAEDLKWFETGDRVAPTQTSAILARHIATEIKRLIDDPDDPTQAGDVLVLVQGRSGQGDLFQTLIREFKALGLPVAGADRMRLDAELAVMDLRALLSFLALPEDNLSLATVLRSPLFEWSEDALYRLAAKRNEPYLWSELRARAAEYPETEATLRDLRNSSDFLRPYDLLERLLVRHDGRRRLVARLGAECEDAIDAFLSLALAYEQQDVPSLTGFLAWLDGEAAEVKRALDQTGNAVRVMTVHGAKGLEAPVVILPDTVRAERNRSDPILTGEDGVLHWAGSKKTLPSALNQAAEAKADREAAERQRLLYVAMTRAERRLIVCGALGKRKTDETWHETVRQGLEDAGAVPIATPTGEGLCLQSGEAGSATQIAPSEPRMEISLPDWAFLPPDIVDPKRKTLSPSDLGGAKALPGDGRSEEEALRYGRQVHLLLEHLAVLPVETHADAGVALLLHGEDALPDGEARILAQRVSDLLARPDLAHVFAPDALAEVPLTANLGDARLHGVIDRLIVNSVRVLIVDFKTNVVVPKSPEEVPDGLLRQMAAYASAMGQIYPDRRVETAILWTETAQLMALPHEIVMSGLPSPATS